MALSPQTSRAVKLLTIGATAVTGFHCVFRTDYGPEPHVFTDVQSWYNAQIDAVMGIDPDAVEAERMRRQRQVEERRREEDEWRDRIDGAARRLGEELDDRPGGRGRKHGGRSLTEEAVARER
mmetsp:Transcript_4927/g.13979  ORF Transcript_4927/g.13979 Transcript_4927/m.13979 type:complete len:123 (-) Transcript_4927:364-732(-)